MREGLLINWRHLMYGIIYRKIPNLTLLTKKNAEPQKKDNKKAPVRKAGA